MHFATLKPVKAAVFSLPHPRAETSPLSGHTLWVNNLTLPFPPPASSLPRTWQYWGIFIFNPKVTSQPLGKPVSWCREASTPLFEFCYQCHLTMKHTQPCLLSYITSVETRSLAQIPEGSSQEPWPHLPPTSHQVPLYPYGPRKGPTPTLSFLTPMPLRNYP